MSTYDEENRQRLIRENEEKQRQVAEENRARFSAHRDEQEKNAAIATAQAARAQRERDEMDAVRRSQGEELIARIMAREVKDAQIRNAELIFKEQVLGNPETFEKLIALLDTQPAGSRS